MGAKGDFVVKVTRTETVAAVLPMQDHWLPMSNLDLLLPPVDVGVFFCYKKPKDNSLTFGSMVGVLKKAMAQALVSYYAFAGEVVQNTVGEPELLCNNNGVEFVEAFAEVELRDLNLHNPDESIEGKLMPKKKHGVLSVQATELKCGGLVVACTFDHRVADAYSANMFLVSWAEMAQSKPLSQLPSYRRSLLNPRRPGFYHPSIDDLYVPVCALPPPTDPQPDTNDNQLVSRIYYIEANHLCSLQSLANGGNNGTTIGMGRKRSKLEAFSAFLWKLVAAAGEENKVCRMGIVVDGRTRLQVGDRKTTQMDSYFGNVVSIPFGEKNSEELTERPLSWVADSVHEFLDTAVTEDHFQGLIDWVEAHRPQPLLAKIYAGGGEEGPAFVVSSGQRFPVEKVDLGWGKPAFGSYHFPWGGRAGYVMPMPSPLDNGDWIVYMHLLQRQLDLVEAKAGHVFRALTSDYIKLI
ncbi:unnamed protein product [Ilex paraguariensis]|uniref:Shikimate O-hydroxycinnamoyltransferase n=1 Tax=Ilex paraguariensis TaxID=185542 RepID=A0ABC8UX08_9AQUA